MFNKKNCQNCNKKISKKFEFCPHCGRDVRGNKNSNEELGMIGENDSLSENFSDPFFGAMGGSILNKVLNSTMKMLEKEFDKEMKNTQQMPMNGNFELYINGKKIDPKNIKVSQQIPMPQENSQKQKNKAQAVPIKLFTKEQNKQFLELTRKEPETKSVRRLSNKVIYEIEMPEVKSQEDISINHLSNSIEIKAIGKTKSYFKIIPVGLPVVSYSLEDGMLILELGIKD